MNKGKVYLIGAGPGSPDLITVRGLEILKQAEVIIYDYLVDKRILDNAKEDAELICGDTLGKNRYSDGFLKNNEKVNQLVVKRVLQGNKVIRLKNGDPAIFSRLSQELDALVKNKIDFEIVPGITAASAASACSGIPLTDRRFSSSCVFVTGHEDPRKKESSVDWNKVAGSGTIILYMAVENLSANIRKLVNAGKPILTPVAVIQNASLPSQKLLTGTLADIVKKAKLSKIKPPSILIIGETVKLEKRFNWFKKTKKILFTGISNQRFFNKELVFHLPLIKIVPLKSYRKFDKEIGNIKNYNWIVFSSRYGVQYFFERLKTISLDARCLNKAKIACVGTSTAKRLSDFGISADIIPQEESSKGLIKEFNKIDIKNQKIFMPHSNISDKGLKEALEKQGAKVKSIVVYKNVANKNLPDLDLGFFDEIMFTSPSGVRNFVERYGRPPGGVTVRCIGEATRAQAEKLNLL